MAAYGVPSETSLFLFTFDAVPPHSPFFSPRLIVILISVAWPRAINRASIINQRLHRNGQNRLRSVDTWDKIKMGHWGVIWVISAFYDLIAVT